MDTSSVSHFAAPSEERQSDSPRAGRTPSKARRVTITAACNECRKRKIKCDGERPICASCRRSGRQECVYNTAQAETHGQARKRRHAELQTRSDVYRDLFAALKVGLDDSARGILRQIRAGADPEVLLATINFDEHTASQLAAGTSRLPTSYEFPFDARMPPALTEDRDPYLSSIIYETVYLATPRSRQKRKEGGTSDLPQKYCAPYHTAEMVDPKIESVCAAPWTTVTLDDEFVRQLLRLYFLFEYSNAVCFHKDLFLEDMMTGRTQFCSPLLVNAILAVASHCHLDMADRAEYWMPRTLGYQFLAEAKRLWELECDQGTLTTVQAGVLICAVSNANGVDTIGWKYLENAVAMAGNLHLFSRDTSTTNRKTRVARTFTAWGLFTYQSTVSFQLHRAPFLGLQPMEPLLSHAEAKLHYPEVWVKYPMADHATALDLSSSFIVMAEFGVILNEITRNAFSSVKEGERFRGFRLEEALRYYTQLYDWFEDLPEQLHARPVVLPHHLNVHMHYWTLLINLFEPLARGGIERARSSLSNIITYEQPQQVVQDAHRCLEMVVRLYYIRHGFDGCDSTLTPSLMTVGLRALSQYREYTSGSEASRAALSTLILCAKGLRDQGLSYYLAEAAYRLLRKRMYSTNPEAVFALDDAAKTEEDEDGRDVLIAQHCRSSWLLSGDLRVGDPAARMEDVFRDVSRMDLDESMAGST